MIRCLVRIVSVPLMNQEVMTGYESHRDHLSSVGAYWKARLASASIVVAVTV